ncbi:MAG: hypothetical protein HY674_08665 [Chloroflexi bacterium]|nr:hypothetical protein [Chloroflexota bacterium]
MPLDLLIERWFAIGWLVFGLSHLLYPGKWAALFLPLRERDTGGLLLATFNLPLGLAVVLAHNVWVWGLPLIVTLAGWVMIVKSLFYLFFPRALFVAMPAGQRMERGFRIAGVVEILLGALLVYDSFYRR